MKLNELIELKNADQEPNDNPRLYVEITEDIEAITTEHPYGCLIEVKDFRVDDDGDIYLILHEL